MTTLYERFRASCGRDGPDSNIIRSARGIKHAMARSPKPHYPSTLANVLLITEPHFHVNVNSATQGGLSWRKYKKAK